MRNRYTSRHFESLLIDKFDRILIFSMFWNFDFLFFAHRVELNTDPTCLSIYRKASHADCYSINVMFSNIIKLFG